jgi:hypothetical protein
VHERIERVEEVSLISGVYVIAPSRTATMMSSSRCAMSEISSKPTMRDEPLSVCASRSILSMSARQRAPPRADDALVQALEKIGRLLLELAYECAAVEL